MLKFQLFHATARNAVKKDMVFTILTRIFNLCRINQGRWALNGLVNNLN